MSKLFAVMLVCRHRLRGETNSVGALRDHFECACRSKGLGGRCRRYAGPAGMSIGTGY